MPSGHGRYFDQDGAARHIGQRALAARCEKDALRRIGHRDNRSGVAIARHGVGYSDSAPSMTSAWPVMNDDLSEARNTMLSAISSTLPNRPIGIEPAT